MSQIGHINRFKRDLDSGSRNPTESICLIVNPKAGAGRATGARPAKAGSRSRLWQWEVRVTEALGHGRVLAKQAREEKFNIVAAVGGDGPP